MRKISCLLLLCSLSSLTFAGIEKKLNEVRSEGKQICRIRQATELARTLIRDSFPHRLPQIGDYVALTQGTSGATVVCFQKNSEIAVMRFSFDEPFANQAYRVDSMYIAASATETSFLRVIRCAEDVVAENRDQFFDLSNPAVHFRYIPTISKSTYTVYAIPELKNDTTHVVFGGDYLMRFDRQLRLLIREKLHDQLTLVPKQSEAKRTVHEHGKRHKLITATDYATLLYVRDRVNWKEHATLCRKRVFITEPLTGQIRVVRRKDYEQ